MTVRLDLTASRNEAWRPTIDYVYTGGALPLDGASIRMQWRLYEGAPGAALITLDDIDFIDTVPNEHDIATGIPAGARILRLLPVMGAPSIDPLPSGLNNPEPGDADRFVYDAVITYADTATDRYIAGFVYVAPGVTLPA